MAKGPCPVCKAPISIAKQQKAVKCGECGTAFRVVRKEGRVRLRRAEAKAANKPQRKSKAKQQSSNRTFLIGFGILALIFVVSIAAVILLLLSQSGGM